MWDTAGHPCYASKTRATRCRLRPSVLNCHQSLTVRLLPRRLQRRWQGTPALPRSPAARARRARRGARGGPGLRGRRAKTTRALPGAIRAQGVRRRRWSARPHRRTKCLRRSWSYRRSWCRSWWRTARGSRRPCTGPCGTWGGRRRGRTTRGTTRLCSGTSRR